MPKPQDTHLKVSKIYTFCRKIRGAQVFQSQKTNIEAGGGQFANLREGAWQEREGGVFEGRGG